MAGLQKNRTCHHLDRMPKNSPARLAEWLRAFAPGPELVAQRFV